MPPILIKGAAVIAGTMLACVAVAYSGGVVEVDVHEKRGDRHHIYLPLPALAAPIAVRIASKHHHLHTNGDRDFQHALPALCIAAEELEHYPDFEMVSVESAKETVHVRKSGGDFVVDVDSPDETVHVSVPIRMAVVTLHQLQSRIETNGPAI